MKHNSSIFTLITIVLFSAMFPVRAMAKKTYLEEINCLNNIAQETMTEKFNNRKKEIKNNSVKFALSVIVGVVLLHAHMNRNTYSPLSKLSISEKVICTGAAGGAIGLLSYCLQKNEEKKWPELQIKSHLFNHINVSKEVFELTEQDKESLEELRSKIWTERQKHFNSVQYRQMSLKDFSKKILMMGDYFSDESDKVTFKEIEFMYTTLGKQKFEDCYLKNQQSAILDYIKKAEEQLINTQKKQSHNKKLLKNFINKRNQRQLEKEREQNKIIMKQIIQQQIIQKKNKE